MNNIQASETMEKHPPPIYMNASIVSLYNSLEMSHKFAPTPNRSSPDPI